MVTIVTIDLYSMPLSVLLTHCLLPAQLTYTITSPDDQLLLAYIGSLQSSSPLPRDRSDHTDPQRAGEKDSSAPAGAHTAERHLDSVAGMLVLCSAYSYSSSTATVLFVDPHVLVHCEQGGGGWRLSCGEQRRQSR